MKKFFIILGVAAALFQTSVNTLAQAPVAPAPVAEVVAPAPAKADPNDQQRISDLEAYVNNTARGSDAVDSKVASKISGAGPGHNGFQMVCAALVLFMTLPGLFLFMGA